MFTGIIEELGQIKRIIKQTDLWTVTVKCQTILDRLKIGDSIAIDGVCLTVIKFDQHSFTVQLVKETLNKSAWRFYQIGDWVNLERALLLNERINGHLVLGHVDCLGVIKMLNSQHSQTLLKIEIPINYQKFLVFKGSIAVNGISLTLAEIKKNIFTCSIIPHTYQLTNLKFKKPGDRVNIEFDILGKYVESLMKNS